jgi:hypothetical protein
MSKVIYTLLSTYSVKDQKDEKKAEPIFMPAWMLKSKEKASTQTTTTAAPDKSRSQLKPATDLLQGFGLFQMLADMIVLSTFQEKKAL